MSSRSYRDLVAWQKSMDLVVTVYKASNRFPNSEQFGLTHQINRAAVSIPSNIAGGQGGGSVNEFQRFLSIARGSLCEVETQVTIAERLGYIAKDDETELLRLADEVGRVLRGLSKSVSARNGS